MVGFLLWSDLSMQAPGVQRLYSILGRLSSYDLQFSTNRLGVTFYGQDGRVALTTAFDVVDLLSGDAHPAGNL